MDEPFGAIDAITRSRLQDELLRIQRQLRKTILFVTHDVEEALRLADKIMVMRAGTIVQYDTPLAIITRPRDSFVRELVGAEDMLRYLSVITVSDVLAEKQARGRDSTMGERILDEVTTIGPDGDLRSALSRMLSAGVDVLTVVGHDDHILGQISFADIHAATAERRRDVEV